MPSPLSPQWVNGNSCTWPPDVWLWSSGNQLVVQRSGIHVALSCYFYYHLSRNNSVIKWYHNFISEMFTSIFVRFNLQLTLHHFCTTETQNFYIALKAQNYKK